MRVSPVSTRQEPLLQPDWRASGGSLYVLAVVSTIPLTSGPGLPETTSGLDTAHTTRLLQPFTHWPPPKLMLYELIMNSARGLSALFITLAGWMESTMVPPTLKLNP